MKAPSEGNSADGSATEKAEGNSAEPSVPGDAGERQQNGKSGNATATEKPEGNSADTVVPEDSGETGSEGNPGSGATSEKPDGSDADTSAPEKPEDNSADASVSGGLGETQPEESPAESGKPGDVTEAQPEGKPADSTQPENQGDSQEEEDSQAGETETRTVEEVIVPDVELPENAELFDGYVYQLFYGDAGVSLYGNVGGERLTGDEEIIYNTLKNHIEKIASGEESVTKDIVFSAESSPLSMIGSVTGTDKEIQQAVSEKTRQVLRYLLMDCPYDLYWFDKTVGMGAAAGMSGSAGSSSYTLRTIRISFAVAKEYQGTDQYTVDPAKVNIAKSAAEKAKTIVAANKDKTDYEKLVAYRKNICDLVSYNDDAAKEPAPSYGNPWQLIWVFDGDENTKVVCEGYSKAFQYLCDLSTFAGDTTCYTVTGIMSGGTGAGRHMWNIVTIEGENYLVDVTNCDTGTVGAPDRLFLAGAEGSVAEGYKAAANGTTIIYTYDTEQIAVLGDVLKLAGEPYQPKGALTITAPSTVTVTYGDTVSESVLTTGGSAVDSQGNSVAGEFTWAADVKSYGDAGNKTLSAVFTPTNTADYRPVSNIKVNVTVNRKTVNVTANIAEKTYGTTDPKFNYTAVGLVGQDTLNGDLAREEGEDVKAGGYAIVQGTLTNEKNPNYNIQFTGATLTITPAECKITVNENQNVLEGIGDFTAPSFQGVKGENLEGDTTYSYGTVSNGDHDAVKAELAKLPLKETGTITYSFAPKSPNYSGPVTGTIQFTIKDIEFLVGEEAATLANAVTLKKDAAYGDTWEQIVAISAITAKAGTGSDSEKGHFTLTKTGRPNAGAGQEFSVVYNGTVGGKIFKNEVVCTGKVDVAKRTITVTAGSYKVSKVYDKSLAAGTASGALEISGILQEDTNVSVSTAPVDYTNPNVGGQARMELPLMLEGDTIGNYMLAGASVTVPCEITPKSVVPVMEITGSYSYTGQAIVPTVTVKVEEEVLAASDYEVALRDNINAGTATVSVTPKDGSNYTWSSALTGTFSISKVDYPYARTAELSARYGNDAAFDLASLLPAGYKLGTLSVADQDGILQGTPAVSGTILSYTLNADRAKVGKKAVITVPVTESTNYNAFELALTVTMSDKLGQTEFRFRETVASKVYGDGSFTAEVMNAAPSSTLSFTSSNPNVAIVDNSGKVQILNAGSTVLTAWASETNDYIRGTAVCTLNVAPKALTWDVSGLSAVDREGTITEQKKASLYGELRVSGILEADKGQAVFTCPANKLTGTYAAVTPGAQRVILAWADAANPVVLQGARAANYILPSALPECTGRINPVSGGLLPPAESTSQVQYNLSMEKGISQVPPALANIESLNTPAKMEAQMKLNIQNKAASVSQDSVAVYDITLMVNVNGAGWQVAGKSNFPANGLTITLPYPEGTGRDSNDFVVCHLFTEDMNGHKAGDVEYPAVTKTDSGIRFKVYGLSPISVGWTKAGELNNAVEETQTEDISSDSQQNAAANSPKTSDENGLAGYLISMAVSGGLLAGMFLYRRRRNGRSE